MQNINYPCKESNNLWVILFEFAKNTCSLKAVLYFKPQEDVSKTRKYHEWELPTGKRLA